jgi:hypothetical protein
MLLEQDCFELLQLRLDLFEPGGDSFFFDPRDPMDRGERLALGEQGEAFDDRFLTMVFTVENSASGFGDHSVAGGTAVSLAAFAGKAEFDEVEASDASIVRALLVPAKGARFFKLVGLGPLRTCHHAENINNSKPGDHPLSFVGAGLCHGPGCKPRLLLGRLDELLQALLLLPQPPGDLGLLLGDLLLPGEKPCRALTQ